MKYCFIFILFLCVACDENPTGTIEPSLNEPFRLGIGESAVWEHGNYTLTFESVPEDSRCPVNANCFWAGNALMLFSLNDNSKIQLDSFEGSRDTLRSVYQISFVNLFPAPHTGRQINPKNYRVELILSEL